MLQYATLSLPINVSMAVIGQNQATFDECQISLFDVNKSHVLSKVKIYPANTLLTWEIKNQNTDKLLQT